MERLKMTVPGEPYCFITIECENGERARQVARWLMSQASNIPHPQSSVLSDDVMALGVPKGRGQTVASRIAQLRSKKKGGARGGAASSLRKKTTSR